MSIGVFFSKPKMDTTEARQREGPILTGQGNLRGSGPLSQTHGSFQSVQKRGREWCEGAALPMQMETSTLNTKSRQAGALLAPDFKGQQEISYNVQESE